MIQEKILLGYIKGSSGYENEVEDIEYTEGLRKASAAFCYLTTIENKKIETAVLALIDMRGVKVTYRSIYSSSLVPYVNDLTLKRVV